MESLQKVSNALERVERTFTSATSSRLAAITCRNARRSIILLSSFYRSIIHRLVLTTSHPPRLL